ncbi:2,3-bisphosphoglycerate-independent phosphoglycerate mutase [Pelagovum pacificum]|uniref:2,3-bisphosphoglycerate-independent phosphoglycerate mutase n=1 Tax=Pelagovum pacificum TaxID=2588711 RepID=A0A5C5GHG0_9RHOB|nr:2,3-bisphosphoglycerate-independent phosphoglycerate mutase [Pelagovum pacificum]QQA42634.1 2,3-bisphosphoglycerate-independent phosphoglycerate mutase [Pelagovum pacificum]TNY34215.1 2,3-bisphosphoglycerate-independent phosphoglycerate mutase [Pelagovum pacificum]
MAAPKPVVLCILDGWGLREEREANAPVLADTPTFDRLMETCPHGTLVTYGPDVGLPEGQMGNSEVGHTNIGAGRTVAMDLGQIDLALQNGTYKDQRALQEFIGKLKESGGRAHLLGVVSDGGVHGHIAHLKHTIGLITEAGVPVVVHAITDGRDVAPKSGESFLEDLMSDLPSEATVGTVTGRYYAMDRDNRWERVEQAYDAMVLAKGNGAPDPVSAIKASYEADKTDEFVVATVIGDYDGMKPEDGVFCLNFRADRAREILRAIADPEFDGFERELPKLAARLGMVDYSEDHNAWYDSVFPKKKVVNTLGAWVASKGLTQFRLAETEKYPHVTFFLNGGKEEPEEGEDRFMPKSPKVATYDLQPEMSAPEVSEKFVEAIEKGYDLIVVNFANPDMVGHTGDLDAAMKACEAVDKGLGQALDALEKAGGAMVVIADHGNCETMVDPETGGPHTSHTTNLVPVIVYGGPEGATVHNGILADVAPTVLDLMGLDLPEEMTGKSLIDA